MPLPSSCRRRTSRWNCKSKGSDRPNCLAKYSTFWQVVDHLRTIRPSRFTERLVPHSESIIFRNFNPTPAVYCITVVLCLFLAHRAESECAPTIGINSDENYNQINFCPEGGPSGIFIGQPDSSRDFIPEDTGGFNSGNKIRVGVEFYFSNSSAGDSPIETPPETSSQLNHGRNPLVGYTENNSSTSNQLFRSIITDHTTIEGVLTSIHKGEPTFSETMSSTVTNSSVDPPPTDLTPVTEIKSRKSLVYTDISTGDIAIVEILPHGDAATDVRSKDFSFCSDGHCTDFAEFLLESSDHGRAPAFVETAIDVVSLGLGLQELVELKATDPLHHKILVGTGVLVDGVAAVMPFVPGGMSPAIKVYRATRISDPARLAQLSKNMVKIGEPGFKEASNGLASRIMKTSAEEMNPELISKAKSTEVVNLINQTLRREDKLPGGPGRAVVEEVRLGLPFDDAKHLLKAEETIVRIDKLIGLRSISPSTELVTTESDLLILTALRKATAEFLKKARALKPKLNVEP